jgi:hypothetical protein
VPPRRAKLDGIEAQASALLHSRRSLLAENAWQEIEVWCWPDTNCPRSGVGRRFDRSPIPRSGSLRPSHADEASTERPTGVARSWRQKPRESMTGSGSSVRRWRS